MSLLYAAYLFGALAVSVPVVLHLLRRRPTQLQMFPSFMFLGVTAAPKQRKNNIRNWIVLALRCLVLALLALAFAWPYLPKLDEVPQQATVLLWDQSFSMDATPYRAQLRSRAQTLIEDTDSAHPMIIGLVGDRVDWSGELTGDPALLAGYFKRRGTAYGTSRFDRALRWADLKLQRMPGRQKRIVLVTDRQLVPWQDVRVSRPLTPGTQLEVETPSNGGFNNVALISARIAQRFTEPGQVLTLQVLVRNFTVEPVTGELRTHVADQQVDQRQIKLKALDLASVVVPLPSLPLESQVGKVELIVEDDVDADNVAYFAANPVEPPTVALTPASPSATAFIRFALNPSAKRRQVQVKDLAPDAELTEYQQADLLIVCDGPKLRSPMGERLDKALLGGARVVAVWSESRTMRQWLRRYDVKARPGPGGDTRRLGAIDFDHLLFATFLKVRVGSFFNVMFFDPPKLQLPPAARVLARFDDAQPAMAELDVGEGKLFVVATAMSRQATDWPTHGSFLPFWRQLLAYAARDKAAPTRFTAGNRPLRLPSFEQITEAGNRQPVTLSQGRFVPRKVGNYLLTDTEGKSTAISVNVPVAESDPLPLSEKFAFDKLMSKDRPTEAQAVTILLPEEQGQSFWWIVLAAVCLFLISEVLLSNRTAM